ncbi:hypothetical protein CLM84_33090 [Streptomyces albidoflavus]|nr:hypothetical protein CLM84_33090 [Streptomyces albidoflavus]
MAMPFLAQGGSSVVTHWVNVALLIRRSDSARRPSPALAEADRLPASSPARACAASTRCPPSGSPPPASRPSPAPTPGHPQPPARTVPAWGDSCRPVRLMWRCLPGCWRVRTGTIRSGRG